MSQYDVNGADEQKEPNMFQVENNEKNTGMQRQNDSMYQNSSGYDPNEAYDASPSNNQHTQWGCNDQSDRGRYHRHDQNALVFIGGVPYSQDSRRILEEIEKEYGVKFANFKPVVIKRHFNNPLGWIAPIPLQNAQMAAELCKNHELRLASRPDLNMHVRKWDSYHHGGGRGRGRGGYQRSDYY